MGQRRRGSGVAGPEQKAGAMRETPGQASPTIASALRPANCQVNVETQRLVEEDLTQRSGNFFSDKHSERKTVLDFQYIDVAVAKAIEVLEHLDYWSLQCEVGALGLRSGTIFPAELHLADHVGK